MQRRQQLKGGQQVTLYFFAGEPKEGAIEALPNGYEVSENSATGLPLLKKKKAEGAVECNLTRKFLLVVRAIRSRIALFYRCDM